MTDIDLSPRARRVDPTAARDQESTAFERARDADLVVDETDDVGHYRVRVDDGEIHEVELVEDAESHVGSCDCKGWRFHANGEERLAGGSCAHICAVAMRAALDDGLVPTVDGHTVDPLVDEVEAEVVEHGATEDDTSNSGDGDRPSGERSVGCSPSDQNSPHPERSPVLRDEESVDDLDEFVSEVAGVPSVFVVDMGRGSSSKPYVTKEGLNYIARKVGIQTRAEPISPSWEDDGDIAAYRGVAVDDEGRHYEDVATAHAGEVESTVGRENLDELASTRATNRALRLATGCGFASVEEVDESAAITPNPDPDREVVDVDDQDVATDGGRP